VTTGHGRRSGYIALAVAIACFSLGSTLVKASETPGVTVAFWRMLVCSVIWIAILRVRERRWLAPADLRPALVPGALFGLNITAFFTAVGRTSIAHAEFIGALSPLLLIPAGAVFFHERMSRRVPLYGLVALVGLFIVLRYGPTDGEASAGGDLLMVGTMGLWAAYLLTSRHLRQGRSVSTVMAAMMPIATVAVLPLALFSGEITTLTTRSWVFIAILAVITGTGAHGLIVFAQKAVPVGTISLLQVAQPAMAVLWSVLLLGKNINAWQALGMAVVICGLVLVSVESQRLRE
jgi:drug/metabolite transporter (DMT)-like permease